MLGIILYCLGVMYTPGPVNILSLNRGMNYRFTAHVPFSLGVGTAICFWFMLVGYAGSAIVGDDLMPVITALGVCFILYLAVKIITADVDTTRSGGKGAVLGFRDGLLMQLLNPKSFLAVLPVTMVQFPASDINGSAIAFWSFGLAALGFGAPMVYAFAGTNLSGFLARPVYLKWFNVIMGVLLIAVAMSMAYEHIYLVLR